VVTPVLTRKLLRDIRHTAGQFAAVAAVVCCAVAVFVSLRTAYDSLLQSRDAYYARHRFADFFIRLERAPLSALRRVESIPGVWRVRGRIVKDVPLKVPGKEEAIVARIISMPDRRDGLINDIHLVSGSYFPGAAYQEVIVNDRFCQANGLRVGDTIQATINEREETLRIVGTAYSPEYVYAIRTPQQFAPDESKFAIVFARRSFVEDSFNMTNAFNDLVGLLRPGADTDAVLEEAKKRLDVYGVYHKYGRDMQLSNRYLTEEMAGLRTSALAIPLIFLCVAALVLHVILRRMTDLQRGQIGLLCALGYTKPSIARHYVSYAVAVAVSGAAPGALGGHVLGAAMTRMYNMFFRFPSLKVQFSWAVIAQAVLLSVGVCALGAARAAGRIMALQPAVAVRPTAPAGTPGAAGRWLRSLSRLRLPMVWRMSVRNLARAPARSAFTVLGVVTAVMVLVLGMVTREWLNFIAEYQYGLVDRSDMHVDFVSEKPQAASLELRALEGVRRAEGVWQFGAELRNGWRKKTVLVVGLPADCRTYRVHDGRRGPISLPGDGLVVPRRLAEALGLSIGSRVLIDPFIKGKDERPARVRAVVEQYIGLTVYATLDSLRDVLGESGTINGAFLSVARGKLRELGAELDDVLARAAVAATGSILGSFRQTVMKVMNATSAILTLFAAVIAFAVVYNSSSVSIAEQERSLACLCSLGYGRDQVARIATNDIIPLGLAGIALGLPVATLACHGIARLYESDLYKLPVVINWTSYAAVAALAMLFLYLARLAARRRVYRIDMVRRLKTME